jgi:precorrin-3B synthase
MKPRGACPSLAAPMQTGDGLLVRLLLTDAMTPAQLAGLADAAARFGNGLIEVTARGSLQVRGLTRDTAPALAEAVAALGLPLAAGLPVLTSPLAGLDQTEIADPRPLAVEIRRRAAGLERRLLPKVSVVVDGGGALRLDAVPADIRLTASRTGWTIALDDRSFVHGEASAAVNAALEVLERLAADRIRARDLDIPNKTRMTPAPPVDPIASFRLKGGRTARGFGLPFGLGESGTLDALAEAAEGTLVRPGPGGALFAIGLGWLAERRLTSAARRLGLVVDRDDPRRAITACAGAPACASAHLRTRAAAAAIAPNLPAGVRLHLSGCAKRCGQPPAPVVTVVGTAAGPEIAGDGTPVPAAVHALLEGVRP